MKPREVNVWARFCRHCGHTKQWHEGKPGRCTATLSGSHDPCPCFSFAPAKSLAEARQEPTP